MLGITLTSPCGAILIQVKSCSHTTERGQVKQNLICVVAKQPCHTFIAYVFRPSPSYAVKFSHMGARIDPHSQSVVRLLNTGKEVPRAVTQHTLPRHFVYAPPREP
jgi:hypothetical protein